MKFTFFYLTALDLGGENITTNSSYGGGFWEMAVVLEMAPADGTAPPDGTCR